MNEKPPTRVGLSVGRKLFMQQWPQIVRPQEDIASYTDRIVWGQRQMASSRGCLTEKEEIEAALGRIGPLVCIQSMQYILAIFFDWYFNFYIHYKKLVF